MNFHPLSSRQRLDEIERISLPSSYAKAQDLISNHVPFITRDLTNDWTAKENWSLGYLKNKLNGTSVKIAKLNKNNMTDYKSFETMPFSEFADRIKKQNSSPEEGGLYLIVGTIISRHERKPTFPTLESELKIPSFIPSKKLWEVNLWIGAGGNTSILHVDPNCNFLSMLQGHKKILLFPPSQTKLLYPIPYSKCSSNDMLLHSQVDFHDPDFLSRFPNIGQALYYETIVGPGETIYIPPGYWHYIVSGDINIGVNIFWTPPVMTYLTNPIRPYFIHESLRRIKKKMSTIFPTLDKNSSIDSVHDH